ncbi:MAG: ATP-binding protein [Anaerolineales bacterium]
MKQIVSFFAPHPHLEKGSPARLQAQMALFVPLIALFLYFLPELWFSLAEGRTGPTLLLLTGTIATLVAFFLARTLAYRLGIGILLGVWWFNMILDVVGEPGTLTGLSEFFWMIFGLLMGLMLLTPQVYAIYALAGGMVLAIDWLFVPHTQEAFSLHSTRLFMYISAATLLGLANYFYYRSYRERYLAQKEITSQREYLQVLLDSLQSPFYVIDPHTYQIRFANQAARALGIDTGREVFTCYRLTHRRETPCSGLEHPCPLQHVINGKAPYTVEHIHYKPDGSTYYAEVHGYPVFDAAGNVVAMIEYSIDITERKRAEEKIRKLEKAVEYAASGVVITDTEGTIEYANPVIQRMTGYTLGELLGQNPRLLKSGKTPREVYADLWSTIKRGDVWQGELINRRKDGSLYYEFQTIAPVRNERGEITNFVAIKLDVTRQKELEENLRAEKERAEAASRFKSRLLANVSHDMRTPLGAIIGYGEMLVDGVFGNLSEEQKEKIREMVNSAERLNAFITNLLHQAELESGKLRLNPRPFAPAELFKVLSSSLALAKWKGLEVITEIDPSLPPTLKGDLYWMQQILTNLLDNAIKYTEKGQVWVRLRRMNETHWAMEVQDTGIGIPPEKHEAIFEAFTQAEDSHQYYGSGLGLAIVRQLVEEMHGRILLESTPGKGSTFTVVFPIEGENHAA